MKHSRRLVLSNFVTWLIIGLAVVAFANVPTASDSIGLNKPELQTRVPPTNTPTSTPPGAQKFTLNVSLAGTGTGTVSIDPPGTQFNAGTVVTLTATANPGSTFVGWSGDITGSANQVVITMNSNKSVTATFNQVIPQYTLTISKAGTGSGSVTPSSGTQYPSGTVVTLTAAADTGSTFVGWSGDITSSTSPVTITMSSSKIVTATFALLASVTATPTSTGTVTPVQTSTTVATITPLSSGSSATVTPIASTALPSTGLPMGWLAVGIGLVLVLVVARYARQSSN